MRMSDWSSDVCASGLAFIDLAADQTALSGRVKEAVAPVFAEWGIGLCSFFVESLSLPEEVQKHLDKASSMRVLGDLDRYAKFQSAEAIEAAAAQDRKSTRLNSSH